MSWWSCTSGEGRPAPLPPPYTPPGTKPPRRPPPKRARRGSRTPGARTTAPARGRPGRAAREGGGSGQEGRIDRRFVRLEPSRLERGQKAPLGRIRENGGHTGKTAVADRQVVGPSENFEIADVVGERARGQGEPRRHG